MTQTVDYFRVQKPLYTAEQQQVLSGWIQMNLRPYNALRDNAQPAVKTSLELGRIFLTISKPRALACIPTIGQFEYTMHVCGFKPLPPQSEDDLFELYEVSPHSPLLKRLKQSLKGWQ